MRSKLFASTNLASPVAFFNTNAGSTLWVCSTPQPTDLIQAGYEALAWVQVIGVGTHGETGVSTNILSYNTWDTKVVQKAKGITDAGSPAIEVARNAFDPGQIIMRAIAKTNFNYAFKIIRNDPAVVGGSGTTIYNRGLVVGPKRPLGKNEDFDIETFTLGLQQLEIVVDPTGAGVAPLITVEPVITGTAKVANVLTSDGGTATGDAVITKTYQWYAGGVLIPGANASTYTPVAGDVGKIITNRVTASNIAGSASGYSAPTSAVIP